MPVAAAVGAALVLYGAYNKKRAAQKQEKAANKALRWAKEQRAEGIKRLSDANVFLTSEWLYPGLLKPPISKGGVSPFGEGVGISPSQANP